jgi:hypothetical protein
MMRRNVTVLWLVRALWLLQPLAFVPLLTRATEHLAPSGRMLVAVTAWAIWAAVLLAALVPSTVSLTAARMMVPLQLITVAVCATAGVTAVWLTTAAGASVIALLVWFSGETGVAFAQGSAYGAEQRFPLKPPVPLLIPMLVSWLVTAAAASSAIVLLANRIWIVGAVLLGIALTTSRFVAPRFHQLARRWLVVVPVGLVVHDPMMLTENALFRSAQLAAVHLAPADTEAADLTGGTAGVVVEIVLHQMDTIVKTGTRDNPTGTALHVLSILVSPTRPGKALQAAAARRIPVG